MKRLWRRLRYPAWSRVRDAAALEAIAQVLGYEELTREDQLGAIRGVLRARAAESDYRGRAL